MNIKDIVAMLREGKKPLVKVTGLLFDDAWGEIGMLARIVSSSSRTDGTIELWFDYNENKVHNLALQSNQYYLNGGGMGTAFQANMMNEKDIHEKIYFMAQGKGSDVPVELADSPLLSEYCKSGAKVSYMQWLEDELTLTREAYHGCLGIRDKV